MKALEKKIREVEEQHAEESLNNHLEKHDKEKYDSALILLGGLRAVDRLVQNVSSQVISALIIFQDEKMHERLGFKRFADFLNESELSLMTKNEFYKRKDIFESEGAVRYDLFNDAKIPLSTRKRLIKGEVEISIEDDEIIVGESRAPLSDFSAIKAIISDFAVENQNLLETKKKNLEKIERGEKEIENLQKKYDDAKNRPGEASSVELFIRVKTSIEVLTEFAKQQTLVEKEGDGEFYLSEIFAAFSGLQAAYGRNDLHFGTAPKKKGNEFEEVTTSLSDEELASLMD